LTRPPVSLGDLVRAVVRLEAFEPEIALKIAECLGIALDEPAATAPSDRERHKQAPETSGPPVPAVNVPFKPPAPSRGDAATPPGPPLASQLEPLPDDPTPPPPWLGGSLAALGPPESGPDRPGPDASLFTPAWTRQLLRAALAVPAVTTAVDIDRLVDRLSRAEAPAHMPLLIGRSLRRGIHVLSDYGEAMAPFAADRAALTEKLRMIIGREWVQELRFADCPGRGAGAGSRSTWSAYSPPSPGTPVLLLSDLGIASTDNRRPATLPEWLAFARQVRMAGCPLIAFVPYPRPRWPSALCHAIRILQWDRATGVAAVRRALGVR
jgi:hypothetical protein